MYQLYNMTKTIYLFMLMLAGMSAFGQAADKGSPADFAIVDLAANHSGDGYVCIVKYNDGKEYSLEKTLAMTVKQGHLISQYDLDKEQFKVLEYMYDKGYDLQAVSHDNTNTENSLSVRFYFRHRGL
jgi:hypothetical protein